MVDAAGLTGLMSSLKRLSELSKAMFDLNGTNVPRLVIEFQSVILAAQQDAFATQAELFTLQERIRELETELAKAPRLDAETPSELAKSSKADAAPKIAEPPKIPTQPLCPRCGKSLKTTSLQPHPQLGALGIQLRSLECACGYYENKVVDSRKT